MLPLRSGKVKSGAARPAFRLSWKIRVSLTEGRLTTLEPRGAWFTVSDFVNHGPLFYQIRARILGGNWQRDTVVFKFHAPREHVVLQFAVLATDRCPRLCRGKHLGKVSTHRRKRIVRFLFHPERAGAVVPHVHDLEEHGSPE